MMETVNSEEDLADAGRGSVLLGEPSRDHSEELLESAQHKETSPLLR